MTDKTQNHLSTIGRVVSIALVIVGLITYIYGIGELANANAKQIEMNRVAIERSKDDSNEIKTRLAEIETHLIYIRKALDD